MWLKYLCYFGVICLSTSAKILCLIQTPMYSHYTVFHTLYKELAARGHNITLISPFKEMDPNENITSLVIDYDVDVMNGMKRSLAQSVRSNVFIKNSVMEEILAYVTENLLSNIRVQNLLNSKEKFDLVVIPHNQNMAMMGLCYHFNVPCVSMSTFSANRWSNPFMSNAGPPSYIPDILVPFHNNMNFYQRFLNSITYFIGHMYTYVYVLPKQDAILKKYIPNAPSVYDLMYNMSLMLINSHYSMHAAVPYGPNMIEVGGLHILPPKPLPDHLKTFLDDAKYGAVYFSLGTNVNSSFLSKHVKTAILNAFAKLKQRILCKWDEKVSNKSGNLITQKWFPQNDVLGHPNMKLFITQGGQMSSAEAIYHGIPLLGIPFFADQHVNIANSINAGYALSVSLEEFTQENFEIALNELLNNTKYHNAVKKRSRVFHDQPMKPIDTAMFWIEHVIRHKGASHLRSAAANLYWFQYFLIDVIGTLILILIFVYISIKKVIKFIFCATPKYDELLKKIK